jgi:hypothetical protein
MDVGRSRSGFGRFPSVAGTTNLHLLNQNLINHNMTDIIYIAVSILAGGILILFTWSCSKI